LVSESGFGLETDRDLSSQAALGNGANELVKLQDKRAGTMLRLHHVGLPAPVYGNHDFGWKISALPRLKAAAEGSTKPGTHLGDLALWREQSATPSFRLVMESYRTTPNVGVRAEDHSRRQGARPETETRS
jgi:hypothetical protein